MMDKIVHTFIGIVILLVLPVFFGVICIYTLFLALRRMGTVAVELWEDWENL